MRAAIVLGLAFLACLACKDQKPETSGGPPASRTATTKTGPRYAAWPRPELPPVPTTAAVWAAAESSNSAETWDAAAAAYEHERTTCSDCLDVAYAVVLARRNALIAHPEPRPPGDEPVPLPPRVQAVVDALDHYVAIADPSDPDLAGMKFLAANTLNRWHQPDALVRLEAVLRDHRGDPTAEYATNILVDALLRAGRVAEVNALVDELLADAEFLAGKDELRQTLEHVRELIAAN